MSKGVPIPENGLRRKRIIEYEKHKQKKEHTRSIMIAFASMGIKDATIKYMKKYTDLIYNTEKDLEKTIEQNREVLDQESGKEYSVEKVFSD